MTEQGVVSYDSSAHSPCWSVSVQSRKRNEAHLLAALQVGMGTQLAPSTRQR